MDDPTATIIGATIGAGSAIVGAAAVIATTYLGPIFMKRLERPNSVASFLEAMSTALSGMISEFEARRVPHLDGHLFVSLSRSLDDVVSPYLNKETIEELSRMVETTSKDALTIDGGMAKIYGDQVPQHQINSWIQGAQRLRGELQAAAAKLRVR